MALRLDPKHVPDGAGAASRRRVGRGKPCRTWCDQVLRDLQVPRAVLQFMNYPTRFDCSGDAEAARQGEIRVPPLEDYAWRLWDYWERHLDPDLSIDRSLRGAVQGQGRRDHRRIVRASARRRRSGSPTPVARS